MARVAHGTVSLQLIALPLSLRGSLPGDVYLAFAGSGHALHAGHRPVAASDVVIEFPRRPDTSVISDTIPLFYVGRNRTGIWVVREAEGRSGGLFLLKRSALRFARRKSETAGCATMFVAERHARVISGRERFGMM